MRLTFFFLLTLPVLARQQDKAKPPPSKPKVDQKKVDEAVAKGAAFLKRQLGQLPADGEVTSEELVLWTFLHAGVPENDPDFVKLLNGILGRPLARTYCVSLQAMILEELDRVKYQPRIWQCAQFLVDNQSTEGYWGYGTPTTYPGMPAGVPTGDRKKVATKTAKKTPAPTTHQREKPDVVRKLVVKKQRDGSPSDNSNSMYAALGLRACHDAGIMFEESVIRKTQQHWREAQCRGAEGEGKSDVPTGGGAQRPFGWSYTKEGPTYGSMTVGGIGSLAICAHILGEGWIADKWILSGLAWMAKNFTVKENVHNHWGSPAIFLYYYLYGMERAGSLYGTEFFGSHEWYPLGAEFILKEQKADGSWHDGTIQSLPPWDTCWAILFLRRATRRLTDVATVDRFAPKK